MLDVGSQGRLGANCSKKWLHDVVVMWSWIGREEREAEGKGEALRSLRRFSSESVGSAELIPPNGADILGYNGPLPFASSLSPVASLDINPTSSHLLSVG